jgi:hypothetical protein
MIAAIKCQIRTIAAWVADQRDLHVAAVVSELREAEKMLSSVLQERVGASETSRPAMCISQPDGDPEPPEAA